MRPHAPYDTRDPHNPNKGAAREKTLALPDSPYPHPKGWQQTLTIKRYRTPPGFYRHDLLCHRCNKQAYKLFLVLCTPQEYHDANLAHATMIMFRARHPNAPGTPEEAQLIQRYAPILSPRSLLCRHCLNLRYAEPTHRKRNQHPPTNNK